MPARRDKARTVIASVKREGHPLIAKAPEGLHLPIMQWARLGSSGRQRFSTNACKHRHEVGDIAREHDLVKMLKA